MSSAMGLAFGTGLFGGFPLGPRELSMYLLIGTVVCGLLAIAHEIKAHRRNALTAATYVVLCNNIAYFVWPGLLWLAANPWLLHG